MKKLENIRFWFVCVALFTLISCGEEGGLKGTLKIAITDAPVDAENVKAVNVVITNVEGSQNGNWKSFRNFEQPTGVNLLAYTGGKSILLIDQFASPGEFTSIRLSLNIATRNSSLIVNPQSNIVFKNGTSAPLYMAEGLDPFVVLEKSIGISSRGLTDITLDFDLRKSIRLNAEGEYVIDPFVRVVNTNKSAHIDIKILNKPIPEQVVVYAYPSGAFNSSESQESGNRVAFFNAVTSASVKAKDISLGFLEVGNYDLVFVKHNAEGSAMEIMGRSSGIQVRAGEINSVEIDLNDLGPS